VLQGIVTRAENGAEAWLRYAPLPAAAAQVFKEVPTEVYTCDGTSLSERAAGELMRGVHSMLSLAMKRATTLPDGDAFVICTQRDAAKILPDAMTKVGVDGYAISSLTVHGHHHWIIAGGSDRGQLYGVFHVLEEIAQQRPLSPATESPSAPIRWVNQWDNLDGSIERGYAGRSIFFDGGHVRSDLTRVGEYGRLLASVGLNGATVNNVNSDLRTLEPEMIVELSRIADELRPWGVRMSLSVDLSSPQVVGHLATFDPLDASVSNWWQAKVDEIYKAIPDFAGFVIKADSEGRVGPSKYGRTPAEAANCVARALKPHGGVVLYRGFVYNNHLDWHDPKADRARAGFDNFHALDGKFESNVVIQIKHGPIDFQVREPVSPLFGALEHTSQAIELQVTQEYTGQQRHMVFLVPMWKTALDTDLRAQDRSTPVKEIVEGKSFHQPFGGFVGVANVGLDENWLHHPMAMANLYGFGKLAWNPDATTEQIIESWTRLTFGNDPKVVSTIDEMQAGSWHAYEQYTGPLGIGTLTNILGVHYGPGIESAERNGWGQWFRGDSAGIGMDRTVVTGTGYIGQYPPELAKIYESPKTCPDDLLLFMHHVPYTYVLHDRQTVVQYMYDSHYRGAETAATYPVRWQQLKGLIDEQRYDQVLKLFTYQAGHAVVWRDAVNQWFERISGIPDSKGRVGVFPGRIEAESMQAEGYRPVETNPWESASRGKAVECQQPAGCSVTATVDQSVGSYAIAVQYFDLRTGVSRYNLLRNGESIAQWKADDTLPPAVVDKNLDGSTSTRFTIQHVALKPGDRLTLQGIPDGEERAPVDYLELTPE
jgi:alpha-glucuronidase